MFLPELLISFFIALIFSVILVAVFGWQRPGQVSRWNSIIFIFIILFVATWAGAIWMIPFGPVIWGVYLMPFLLAGIMLALLYFLPKPGSCTGLKTSSRMKIPIWIG